MGRNSRTYLEAKNAFTHKEYSQILGNCCKELRELEDKTPQLFDAILIDEAQDFNFEFYKLCYDILREPKRLIWAYDEVQSLESLSIPTAIEIFGTHTDGTPVVELEGNYPDSEIEKDMILYHCYRTPRPIMVTAHFFGMGLLRNKGAVQFIPTPGGWEDIGYEVVSGEFQPGKKVTIKRPEKNSPHSLEKLVPQGEKLVQYKTFNQRSQELNWVAAQIKKNVYEDELKPEEIVVISLDWKNMERDFGELQGLLKPEVKAIISKNEIFRQSNNVTLAGIFRAKGNEASIVYVIGFEQVDSNPQLIVQERNQAFTAMTRARGWCILTGISSKAHILFHEIQKILASYEEITFTVPEPKTIQRNLDNLEYEKRRNRLKKGKELTSKLVEAMNEYGNPEILEKAKEIEELIKKEQQKINKLGN
ncbi:MAG: ATP-binding domain-containing protein [Okeania sp. SIO2C9]|uniref:DEAD/DEAH box helicase n=1 Tax=Okeania sp. SIO2C9 TaxID=2607791 RepID=UPI0013BFDE1B|nr:ATP-binding domain-containing protein [Okeania sp. SIO2C9]NEQ75929.1 ATP-binding domain-containing protein [Okeania sp. SIO2C9]